MSSNDKQYRPNVDYRMITAILYNVQYQHSITTIVHKNGMRYTWLKAAKEQQ